MMLYLHNRIGITTDASQTLSCDDCLLYQAIAIIAMQLMQYTQARRYHLHSGERFSIIEALESKQTTIEKRIGLV
jgi:hypothetical protein